MSKHPTDREESLPPSTGGIVPPSSLRLRALWAASLNTMATPDSGQKVFSREEPGSVNQHDVSVLSHAEKAADTNRETHQTASSATPSASSTSAVPTYTPGGIGPDGMPVKRRRGRPPLQRDADGNIIRQEGQKKSRAELARGRAKSPTRSIQPAPVPRVPFRAIGRYSTGGRPRIAAVPRPGCRNPRLATVANPALITKQTPSLAQQPRSRFSQLNQKTLERRRKRDQRAERLRRRQDAAGDRSEASNGQLSASTSTESLSTSCSSSDSSASDEDLSARSGEPKAFSKSFRRLMRTARHARCCACAASLTVPFTNVGEDSFPCAATFGKADQAVVVEAALAVAEGAVGEPPTLPKVLCYQCYVAALKRLDSAYELQQQLTRMRADAVAGREQLIVEDIMGGMQGLATTEGRGLFDTCDEPEKDFTFESENDSTENFVNDTQVKGSACNRTASFCFLCCGDAGLVHLAFSRTMISDRSNIGKKKHQSKADTSIDFEKDGRDGSYNSTGGPGCEGFLEAHPSDSGATERLSSGHKKNKKKSEDTVLSLFSVDAVECCQCGGFYHGHKCLGMPFSVVKAIQAINIWNCESSQLESVASDAAQEMKREEGGVPSVAPAPRQKLKWVCPVCTSATERLKRDISVNKGSNALHYYR